jgi:hypothetical protein
LLSFYSLLCVLLFEFRCHVRSASIVHICSQTITRLLIALFALELSNLHPIHAAR